MVRERKRRRKNNFFSNLLRLSLNLSLVPRLVWVGFEFKFGLKSNVLRI
jgi:hypothetical protein